MKTKLPQKDYGTCKRNVQLLIDESFAEKVIPADDSVRLLNQMVEEMDLTPLKRAYDAHGRKPATEPSTMDEHSLLMQLNKKRTEIEDAIQAEQEKLRKIELAKNELQSGKGELHYNISVKSIPAYPVLSLRRVVPNYYSEGELWRELSAFADTQKIELIGNTFSIYHDTEYRETDVDIELCAPVKKMGTAETPFCFRMTEAVPYMACTMVYGDFANIKGAYLAFADWLQKNSEYKMANPMRQIVHRGPWNESDPAKYLIELQIPLDRT